MNWLFIMLGGAIGALSRYGVAQLLSGIRLLSMPVGTITVNLIGCFLLGFFTGFGAAHTHIPRSLILMLTVGFCGAFTTFSTFSAESVNAIQAGNVWQTAVYLAISVGIGFVLFWWGKSLA